MSLTLYRQESAKILKVLQKFSDMVEKASCDEAFIDVTRQVELKYKFSKEPGQEISYDDEWSNSLFMGFPKGEGRFLPESECDRKLWIATKMAHQIR